MTDRAPKRRPASRDEGRRERASELNAGASADPRVPKAETMTNVVADTLVASMAKTVIWSDRQNFMVRRSSLEDRLAGVDAVGDDDELEEDKADAPGSGIGAAVALWVNLGLR